MIDEPGCTRRQIDLGEAGARSEASRIRSLAIFDSLIATLFNAAE